MNLSPRMPLVLVVDDDRSIRLSMRATLEDENFIVEEAANGDQALQLFQEHQPELVLLDVVMPGLDGFETCRRLRGMQGGDVVPIMMVTGLEDLGSIEKAFDAGATDFITKPLNWSLLRYRLRYMLRAGQALRDVHRTQERLEQAQQIASLGYWEFDLVQQKVRCSEAAGKILGLEQPSELSYWSQLWQTLHPMDKPETFRTLQHALGRQAPYQVDFRIQTADGERHIRHQGDFLPKVGNPDLLLGTVQDVSQIRTVEQQLRYLAYFDSLTGLSNRSFLRERLEEIVLHARGSREKFALLVLDLDRFNRINDTFGHSLGDRLLKEVASRLQGCVAELAENNPLGCQVNALCRLGGDEFCLLVTELKQPQQAAQLANLLLDALTPTLQLGSVEVCITASVGISLFPADGDNVDALLKNADAAMYHAKAKGRNNYQFSCDDMNTKMADRVAMETELHNALALHQLQLHYQPLMNLASGQVVGFEALLRWQHPQLGSVPPARFIPIAEESGLIIPIGDWVINTACRQAQTWRRNEFKDFRVAINLSSRQFYQPNLVAVVSKALSEAGIPPQCLELELTESMLMEREEENLNALRQLRELGVKLAIDDFGTGYSSLSYLSTFPINTLKIDRSFISRLEGNASNKAIIRAIIAMGHSLELTIVGEGVETQNQKELLELLGCDEAQGYLFARPQPAREVTAFLSANR